MSDFTPADFAGLLEQERQWFEILVALEHSAWERPVPEESPEGQAVLVMLADRARWLRN